MVKSSRRRQGGVVAIVVLLVGACGGGDGPEDEASGDAGSETLIGEEPSPEAAESDSTPTPERAAETVIIDEAEPPVGSDASTGSADAATDAPPFPVTIEHRFGSTTIESEPVRVLSLGNGEEDVLISLGVMPIALAGTFPTQTFTVWPWAQDEYDALLAETGGPEPVVLQFGTGIPFEQIATLEPDVIVAVNSIIEEADYELLSEIAPTVTRPDGYRYFGIPLREWTEIVATAVGRQDRVEQVIDDLDAGFDRARAAHSQFEGATATVAFYSAQSGNIATYPPDDFRHQFLRDLGFEVSEELDRLAGDERFVILSAELIDTIDADVVVWVPGSAIDINATRDLPVREALLTAAQRRSEVVADTLVSNALTNYSPLSVEFVIEELVPELALAADGDPETVAVSAEVLYEDGEFVPTTDEQEAIEVFQMVFDSTVPIEDKSRFVEDFDALRPTFDEFAALADALGDITAEVVRASTDGDTVTVVYNAIAGGEPAIDGLDARLRKVDGVWMVLRDDLCRAVAAAGIVCPS
ncbi:MAG: ABC transporter substrate-binding protein [Actinomycetota bacterium]